MVEKWYLQVEGRTVGPISRPGLVRRIWSGQVGPDSLVRQEGTENWVATSAAPGLLEEAKAVGRPRDGHSLTLSPEAKAILLRHHASTTIASDEESVTDAAEVSGWYIQQADAEVGPLSMEALKKQVLDGQIQPKTLVRYDGDEFWVFALAVPDLADAFESS